jgi:glycyl-tRNA synthetase alpha subunit
LVLSKIKSRENATDNELREIAPLLNTIPKINPYSIPIRYFETFKLPGTENKKHIVVAISKATRKWITYAAAVIVGSVLITGVFYNYNHRNSDISKEMKKISDDELNSYVKEHSMTISYDSVVSTDDFNVQDGLKMISDDELQQYLNDKAETVSSATTSLKTTN